MWEMILLTLERVYCGRLRPTLNPTRSLQTADCLVAMAGGVLRSEYTTSTARINMRCKKRGQDPEGGMIN